MAIDVCVFLLQAPIQVFGIEGRYAHALFAAASKEKKLDVVEKDLQAFEVRLVYGFMNYCNSSKNFDFLETFLYISSYFS